MFPGGYRSSRDSNERPRARRGKRKGTENRTKRRPTCDDKALVGDRKNKDWKRMRKKKMSRRAEGKT